MSNPKKEKDEYFTYEKYKTVNKVNKCSYINDNLKSVIFYLCPCNTEFAPICKACTEVCHRNHLGKVRIVGNYTCICGKQNHLVKKISSKIKECNCFFAKLFEITPNSGFYRDTKDGSQYCAVCHDTDSCIYDILSKDTEKKKDNDINNENNKNKQSNDAVNVNNENEGNEISDHENSNEEEENIFIENDSNIKIKIEQFKKRLVYVLDSNSMNCMCTTRKHNINAISLYSDLTSHKNLPIYMRSFNGNILFKIQSSKQIYLESIVKLIESFNNNPTSLQNYEIFVEYNNNSIFKTLSLFIKYWKNKYVYMNPFLDHFTFEQLINFMSIHKDIELTNSISTNLFYSGKFYFAEIMFSYFIKSHIVKHNHLLNMKTILNLDIGNRMHFIRNSKTFFKYNLDYDQNYNKNKKIDFSSIDYIDKLAKEIIKIVKHFTQNSNNFEPLDFKAPLKSITYIFKYLIKYNLISLEAIDDYFDTILDCLYSLIKSEKDNNITDGFETVALYLIKSIVYSAIYRNDEIIIDKFILKKKNKDEFFFKKNDINLRLIKIFLIVLPYYNKRNNYKNCLIFDFCVKTLIEFSLNQSDIYISSLKLTQYIGTKNITKYYSYKINPELFILDEEKKNKYFLYLYNEISNFTKKIGNENRLYFNFEIPFRLYNKRINVYFQSFKNSYDELKNQIKTDLENEYNKITNQGQYLNFEIRYKIDQKVKEISLEIFKKIFLLTDLMENLEEFIYIYSKGIEYRETDFDLESDIIDIDQVPNYLLSLYTEIIDDKNPILILLITNIKPEIFVPALIRKEHELNEINEPFKLKKDKLIKFLEKIFISVENSNIHINIYPFYLGCIRQLIFLKGLDKSFFYLTHILNLLAKVMKKAFHANANIISVISLVNDIFKKIKEDNVNYEKLINFFKENKDDIPLENFIQKYFYFMSELIKNDITVFDVVTNELISIDIVEEFIFKILNKEDNHNNVKLNYSIMHYYLLKKLSLNISQDIIDDIMSNLFILDNNPFYDISILKLISKYSKSDTKDLENRYNELCNILTIIKSILINYYNPNEMEVNEYKTSYFENVFVKPIYIITNYLLIYDKIDIDLNLQLLNDCINLMIIKKNEIDKIEYENEIQQSENSNISYDKIQLSNIYNKFKEHFITYIGNKTFTLSFDNFESYEDSEYLKYYISEKENTKDEDLAFIEGFKILQRETGTDYRQYLLEYLIQKNFDGLNENYILPSFIQTINKDIFTLPEEKLKKIKNNYLDSVYLPEKIEPSIKLENPNFENAYSIIMLNKIIGRDSTNFQRSFEKIFSGEEGLEKKSVFLSYIIKKLIFTCILIESEKYYTNDNSINYLQHDSPIYLTGIFSIQFIQNLCEGHNKKEQNYFFNTYFKNKIKKRSSLKRKSINDFSNHPTKRYEFLLHYHENKNEKLKNRKSLKDFSNIRLESSFFNFLFYMLRIIMYTVYPLTGKSRTELRNKDEINTKNLQNLYTGIIELIIEMLQGCEKDNYKYLFQITPGEVFTQIMEEDIQNNIKMKQLYQPIINAYEVSEILFKDVPSLKFVYKEPSKIHYKVPYGITFDNEKEKGRFSEICLSIKYNEFKLLNNIISQNGLDDTQVKLISLIFDYNNLTTVITDLLVGIYNNNINQLKCNSDKINLTPEKKNELMECFKYGNLSDDIYFNLASQMFLFITIMAEMYKIKEAKECIKKKKLNYDLSNSRYDNNSIITVQFFSEITKSVEFRVPVIDSIKLKTIYFIINPKFYKISYSTLNKFFKNVDRTNSSTKLGELIRALDSFMNEIHLIKNPHELIDYNKVIYYNFFVSLFINFLFLLFNSELSNLFIYFFIKILSIIQLSVNIFLLYKFFQTKYLYYVTILKNKYDTTNTTSNYEEIINFFHIYILDSFLINEEIFLLLFIILMGLFGILSKYYLFFYVLQLVTVINFTDTIYEIVQAFYIRFTQLICMIGFLAILIFFFSNVGFYFYIDEFNTIINNMNENYCQSLVECFVLYFYHGVRAGGGIGDILPEKSFVDMNSYFIRWITDIIFYITVILLLLNMINGIIVSTFSQIRELSQIKEEDINQKCFICGQSKEDFEKNKIDFHKHTTNEHNVWNYIMFFVNLKCIKEKDLDSDQTYIAQKLEELDIAFFPVGQSQTDDLD